MKMCIRKNTFVWITLISILFFTCFGLNTSISTAAEVNAEILPNPGFEINGGYYDDGTCNFNIQDTTIHSGSKAGICSNRSSANSGVLCGGYIKPEFIDKNEGIYTIGAWVKLASGTDTVILQLAINDSGTTTNYQVTGEANTGWTYITGTVDIEFSQYFGDVKFKIFTTESIEDFYVDDCTIYKGTNYIPIERQEPPSGSVSGPDLSELQYLMQSDDYRVWIDGEEEFVYKSLNNAGNNARYESISFINFYKNEPAEVKVYPEADIYDYQIRPYSYDIISAITDDGMITFNLQPGEKVILTLGENYDKALVICANPQEDVPEENEVTHYYGPGVHEIGHWSQNGAEGILNSGDTVYIAEGAVVSGAFKADDQSNIKIYGKGILYGGDFAHDEDFCMVKADCITSNVDNITIEGITFTNSAGWIIRSFSKDNQSLNVTNLTIKNIKEIGQWHYNTDGIQIGPDGFLVEDCFLQTNDDNFSLNGSCRNGEICNNIHWVNRNGGVYTLGWGCTHLENLNIHDNIVYRYGSKLSIDSVFPLEMTNTNAIVKNISYRDIIVEDMGAGTYWVDYKMKSTGTVEDIYFYNITFYDSKPGRMSGNSSAKPIKNVTIKNVTLGGIPVTDQNSARLNLSNVEGVQYIYDDNPLPVEIIRFNLVNIETTAETPPILPSVVTAVYNNGTTAPVSVTWDNIEPSNYAQAGTFIVNGYVDGTSIVAVANVTVNEEMEPPVNEYQATAIRGTPVIDGNVDDIWNDVPEILTDRLRLGEILTIGAYRMMWDDNNIYVLAQVDESSVLNSSNSNIWENDSVEFFVDEDNAKSASLDYNDRHIIISYENRQRAFDSIGLDGVVSATNVITEEDGNTVGYIVEIKMPFIMSHDTGDVLGFDGQVNSTDGTGNRVSISGWSGNQNQSDQSASVWGELTLIDDSTPIEDKSFVITPIGDLNRIENGLEAQVNVVQNGPLHQGNEVVLFQLFNGNDPLSIIALEKNITQAESLTAYFTVEDSTNTNYSVKVYVLNEYNTDVNMSEILSEIITMN